MKFLFMAILALSFAGCSHVAQKPDVKVPVASPTPVPTPKPGPIGATPAPVVIAAPAIPNKVVALSWETGHPERKAWSAALREGFSSNISIWSAAKDRAEYCKNYDKLPVDKQVLVWQTMAVEIARYESGFNPVSAMTESDGNVSQGIFQLTYGDAFCPKKKSEGDLNAPLVNIACGLKIMHSYVKKDGVVASGGYVNQGAPAPKGLAHYWSVTRVPDKKSKHKKAAIQAVTKALPGCA